VKQHGPGALFHVSYSPLRDGVGLRHVGTGGGRANAQVHGCPKQLAGTVAVKGFHRHARAYEVLEGQARLGGVAFGRRETAPPLRAEVDDDHSVPLAAQGLTAVTSGEKVVSGD
jgi:hypothetical protein